MATFLSRNRQDGMTAYLVQVLKLPEASDREAAFKALSTLDVRDCSLRYNVEARDWPTLTLAYPHTERHLLPTAKEQQC